jgi:hypothetical protein
MSAADRFWLDGVSPERPRSPLIDEIPYLDPVPERDWKVPGRHRKGSAVSRWLGAAAAALRTAATKRGAR